MNFLFRVIYAAHANGTHEKLALDALRYLEIDEAPAWRSLFLKHVDLYMSGSKAPDREFKDFKNHVLHVRDNYWGGAPEKAESWYQMLVRELKKGNWEQAVWCAGVLSHYYTDPIHPFHTAQCEAETNIHRAVEWSISRSYNDLRKRGLKYGMPVIDAGPDESWLKDMVIAGAELANCDYETLIAGYNFQLGTTDPPAGLDTNCRNLIGRLIVYSNVGFSKILDRAFVEAGISAPLVNLTSDTFLAVMRIPRKWVLHKLENASEIRRLQRMYDEYEKTGRVNATLSEDLKIVRDMHAEEVLIPLADEWKVRRAKRRQSSPCPQGRLPKVVPSRMPTENISKPDVPLKSEQNVTKSAVSAAQTVPSIPRNSTTSPKNKAIKEASAPKAIAKVPYLQLSDHVEAGPSVGPKTAERLEGVGIVTVQDLLDAEPKSLAGKLNIRYVNRKAILDWQDQARLMIHIPGLRVTHAQLCVGAGYRTPKSIATANASELSSAILKFAATRSGQRMLGTGTPPDFYTVREWVDATDEALAA